ncbi:MAG: hypothetical protein Kow00121_28270 [Elainellaceae cyanobacterium]
MDWTNLIIFGVGVGIGAIATWFAGKAVDQPLPSNPSVSTSTDAQVPNNAAKNTAADIEVKKLQQQLQQMQLAYYQAKEMAQFQAGFLARTSHELRSPINSAISLHQLILADLCEDPAEEREFVAQASAAAQKMLAVLDQLIKVSKAIYGSASLRLQPVSLEEILLEVYQFTYLQAQNRNLRLNIEFPDPDVDVFTDRDWLRQVLVSLMDAPLHYMEEGQMRVTTQVDLEAQQAHILIEDERPADFWNESIDLLEPLKDNVASDLQKQPFQKAELADLIPSPGLMLLVNQSVLQQMGGHLEILSAPIAGKDNPSTAAESPALTRIRCTVPIAS